MGADRFGQDALMRRFSLTLELPEIAGAPFTSYNIVVLVVDVGHGVLHRVEVSFCTK